VSAIRPPAADPRKANVALKIIKDDHPVDSVVIGEQLTAIVESDIERKQPFFSLIGMCCNYSGAIASC
jgi:hypothetical protein